MKHTFWLWLQQEKCGRYRAITNAIPVMVSKIPAIQVMITNVGIEDAALNFCTYSLAYLDIERLTKKKERFSQHKARFCSKKIDHAFFMGREHPIALLTNIPEIILYPIF